MTASRAKGYPSCPSCGRQCEPGVTWKGANYCRGLILLRFIEDQPGLSGWELSQLSSVPYSDATRGLSKLREWKLVRPDSEDRGDGTIRYRYWPINDSGLRARFMEVVRRVELLNHD
jgi:DNA-binding IclR family transcriptional regulator